MNKFLIATAAFVLALGCIAPAFAHDEFINLSFGSYSPITIENDDLAPFKGSATLYVTNDTQDPFSDLHIGISSLYVNGAWTNISKTIFVDPAVYGAAYTPISSQSGLSWNINNNPAGAQMDLIFTDFLMPGEIGMFKVFTDNSVYQQKFALTVYPTSDYVPEPSSIVALLSGVACLGGLAIRRKR